MTERDDIDVKWEKREEPKNTELAKAEVIPWDGVQFKGSTTRDLTFPRERATREIDLHLRGNLMYIELSGESEYFGDLMLPVDTQQLTRFAIVRAIGPDVEAHGHYKVGDIVGVPYMTGSWLYAPAFGWYDERHKICTEDGVWFKVTDKEQHGE